MAQSRYFRYTSPKRQQYNDNSGTTGLAAGAAIGKLLGGLSTGIQDMQKNVVANRLMDEASISEQPGAGQTLDLGKLGGDSGPSDQGNAPDPQDLGAAPVDPTFTNPSSGNIEPLQDPNADAALAQGVAAARLGSGPTVGSSGGPQPAAASPPSTGDFTLNPSDYTGGTAFGGKTTRPGSVGGLVHTGGTDEMDLQKQMLGMKLQKSQEGRATAEEARAAAKEADPIQKAQKLLELRKTQAEIDKANRPEKEDKKAPPQNIDSEPVRDTNQLGDYVDNQYGNGTYSGLVKAVTASGDTDLAPPTPAVNADGTPKLNPDGSQVMEPAKSVTIPLSEANPLTGEPKKSITLPLRDAQIFVRQTNLQRAVQGLPPLPVPGEDKTLGLTKDKPIVAETKLGVLSTAPGRWVLPPGATVPVQAWTVGGQRIKPSLPKRRI